jgi:hypothetical protein
MNRRRTTWLWALVAAVSWTALAPAAAVGQLAFGAHGSRANDLFGGVDGVGARAGLRLGPASVFAVGDWYFPECLGPSPAGGCEYRSGSLMAALTLPTPGLSPYVMAGVGRRWTEPQVGSTEPWGVAGVGLRAGLAGLAVFAELQAEGVRSGEARRWVFRVGFGS